MSAFFFNAIANKYYSYVYGYLKRIKHEINSIYTYLTINNKMKTNRNTRKKYTNIFHKQWK